MTRQLKNIMREATEDKSFVGILKELESEVVLQNSENHLLSNFGYLVHEYKISETDLISAFEKMDQKTLFKGYEGYERFIYNISKIFERALKEKDIPVIINN